MLEWPVLEVVVRHTIGVLELNVEFQLSTPWTVLFAPSGAGKTTVMRAVAGLMRTQDANIVWKEGTGPGRPLNPPHVLACTSQGRFVPAHARCLPMVTQDPALFPHLTVAENVSYGLRRSPAHRGERQSTQELFRTLLGLCRIEHLVRKTPMQLSGGERQRVALARALGANGSALLLDEPFSGMDGALKDELMRDIKAWLEPQGVPVLHITHDVGEAFAIADDVIVLDRGRVVGQGPPDIVLREERERLLACLRL